GLDNDCDGMTDEGCLRPVGSADLRIDTQTTESQTNSLRPVIAARGANVQVVWSEAVPSGSQIDARVFYTHSTNNGGTFATPVRLNTTGGDTFRPQVVFGASNVLWGWADFRGGTSYREIWTRRSTDAAGSTLAAEVRVNGTGDTVTRDSFEVRLAAGGTQLFVIYEAFVSARSRHIFFSRSTDGGATWTTPVQVSSPGAPNFVASHARIAATPSRVYIVWRDNRNGSLDVFVRVWDISTNAFVGPEQRVDTGTAPGASSSFSPEIAAEGNNVYVAWVDDRDGGSFDIWFNRSNDQGVSWLPSAIKLDNDPLPHDSIGPQVIAPAPGVVLVGWIDYRSGFPDPYITRSTNAGMSFEAPVRLDTGTSPGASGSHELAIAGAGNLIGAVWSDERSGALDIYANFSLDGGATWQPSDYRLDTSMAGSSDSQEPVIAIANNRIHVVWRDHRRGSACPVASGPTCPNGDIYYRRMEP
ncbi:MAG: glycoside hydrolase, partial [Sandaracinaceae bacterium]|nr:glycoside hydrolase [Sandaracinaceae bacterium]